MYAKNFTNFSWLTSGSSNARGSTRRTWSQSTMRWDTFSTTYSTRTSPTSTGRNSTIPTVQEPHLPLQVGTVLPTVQEPHLPLQVVLYLQYKNLTYLCKYCSNCKRLFLKNSLLFRSGANPGFHEGVADIISLAVGTATYFQRLGTATVDP